MRAAGSALFEVYLPKHGVCISHHRSLGLLIFLENPYNTQLRNSIIIIHSVSASILHTLIFLLLSFVSSQGLIYVQGEIKKKAEAEAAKEAEASSSSKGLGYWVVSLFQYPPLSFLQGPLEPVLETIEDNTIVAAAVALGLASIPVFVLSSLFSSKVH